MLRPIGYAISVAAGLSVGIAGYKHQQSLDGPPSRTCEAVDTKGQKIDIVSYPIGKVAVEYQEDQILFNHVSSANGTISLEDTGYTLHVPGLPEDLDNTYTDFRHTDAMVMITLPKLGQIGLTERCIEESGGNVHLPIE